MAYHHANTHDSSSFLVAVQHRIADLGHNIMVALDLASQSQARADQINRLNAKTDLELADMGLQRQNISYYVYRDLLGSL